MSRKKMLITGKGSYVGGKVIEWLGKWPDDFVVEELSVRGEGWKERDFSQYDVVLHVAGIAHVSADPKKEQLYYQVNRDLAVEVARKAKEQHVAQFIFMSSIIIYGNTGLKGVIDSNTVPKPRDFYGRSKLQAELAIRELGTEAFSVVVLRPPMIYGHGTKGNYSKLSRVSKTIPFFPDAENLRSMLYIDNLCELIRLIIMNGDDGVFYPQNKEYTKTSHMVTLIARVHGKNVRLTKLFNPLISYLSGKVNLINKIFGSLIYDQSMSGYKDEYRVISFEESIVETERGK